LAEVILRMSDINKFFGGVRVLHAVSFDVCKGEVHALVGENGAGKSTLMKILMGVYPPDGGKYSLNGEEVKFSSPFDAQRHGVSMIYQEFGMAPLLSVAENISLGKLPLKRSGLIDWRQVNERASEMLEEVGSEAPFNELVGCLPKFQQQEVEIARALFLDPVILIMDEPTSALSYREISHLHKLINMLCGRGVGIVYISHKLEEVLEIADRVTILRDGFEVATQNMNELKIEELMRMITGRTVELHPHTRSESGREKSPRGNVIELEHLGLAGLFHDINMTVKEKEIVGVAGLIGAGKTELSKAIFGALPKGCHVTGRYIFEGEDVEAQSINPHKAMQMGIGLVTEDRQSEGLLSEQSVLFNLTLTALNRLSRFFVLLRERMVELVKKVIGDVRLRPPEPDRLVKFLSGGNQQKVVIGKWLARQSKLLILDEPTCGVDVGARQEIYDLIRAQARQGTSVLILSSDVNEILGISDRILIMRKGRIVNEVMPGAVLEDGLLNLMLGAGGEENV